MKLGTVNAIASDGPNASPGLFGARRDVLAGASVLTLGAVLAQVIALVRGVFMARWLGPEQYGLAATLLLVMVLVEMVSALGIDTSLVQAPEGDRADFLGTSHTMSAIRGCAMAIMVAIAAFPLAWLFSMPQHSWVFTSLAVIPLLTALAHLDRKRLQRHLRFGPDLAVDLLAQFGGLTIALTVAWASRSFLAALAGMVASALCTTVVSHLVAERAYRWAWHEPTVRRLLSFGWPLLINGILLFWIFQGERLLLASAPRIFPNSAYTMSDLGLFTAAGTVALAPALIAARLSSSLALPMLSAAQNDPRKFGQRYNRLNCCLWAFALLSSVSFLLCGDWIMRSGFGEQYASAGSILAFLGVSQSIRVLRIGPTIASLATGDSQNLMWGNLARAFGTVFAVLALWFRMPLLALAYAAVAAEVIAYVVSLLRFSRAHPRETQALILP